MGRAAKRAAPKGGTLHPTSVFPRLSRPGRNSMTNSTGAPGADTVARFALRPAALDHAHYHRFSRFFKEGPDQIHAAG